MCSLGCFLPSLHSSVTKQLPELLGKGDSESGCGLGKLSLQQHEGKENQTLQRCAGHTLWDWTPVPSSLVIPESLNGEEWETLEPHCHRGHSQLDLGQRSIDILLPRGQGWKEGKTGPERGFRAAWFLWCITAGITHPLQSTKASPILCQSDSLSPPREKFWSSAMTGQPCCGCPHSCRSEGC